MVRYVRSSVFLGSLLQILPLLFWGQAFGQTAPLGLTLDDAIKRGIRNNLAGLERQTGDNLGRLDRVRALSALLPAVNGAVSENVQQNSLAVFGFRFPGVPNIIGPFGYSDVRAFADMDLYNRAKRLRLKVAEQDI